MAPRKGHFFKPILQRFEEKMIPEPNSGCWLWFGATNGGGYGKLGVGNKDRIYAHRFSFETFRGPIPEKMHIDHLCRNPSCVNPEHLEAVTNAENTRRGKLSAMRPERSICCRGHQLSETAYTDSQGHKQCRKCLSIRQRAYYERKTANVVHQ